MEITKLVTNLDELCKARGWEHTFQPPYHEACRQGRILFCDGVGTCVAGGIEYLIDIAQNASKPRYLGDIKLKYIANRDPVEHKSTLIYRDKIWHYKCKDILYPYSTRSTFQWVEECQLSRGWTVQPRKE